MRVGQMVSGFVGFALMVGVGQTLLAQTSTPVISGRVGTGFAVGRGVMPGNPFSPYTATRKTTQVQTLANGTTITRETTVKEARDSSGRTYRESKPEFPMGSEGAHEFVTVNVSDPVSRTDTFWNSSNKEAIVTRFPETRQLIRTEIRPVEQTAEPMPTPRVAPANPQIEDLGMKTINGVEAKGTRTTRVIPAGREGNDQPITVTTERWVSEDLRMAVMSIHDDPRSGTTTMELTDIEKGEPDPALFQVPEGYTVKDRTPVPQN